MAKVIVFRGSPRKEGNTNALEKVIRQQLLEAGHEVRLFDLYDMDIRPCTACRFCQQDWTQITCSQSDDMDEIFREIVDTDLLLLATPIYSWYATPPAKALLDRLVYALCMYYGEERGPALASGKAMALIVTCGYPPERGADLLEEGIRRYCKHMQMDYRGMLCERHKAYADEFMDEGKNARARAFADKLASCI